MQADPVTHQLGRQHHALERLPHAEYCQNQHGVQPILKLKHHGDDRSEQTNECSQVRDDTEQTSAQSDDQCEVQADGPQANGVDQTKRDHHHQLTADEGAQDIFDFPAQRTDNGF